MSPFSAIMPVVNLRANTNKREEVKVSRSSAGRILSAAGMPSLISLSSGHRIVGQFFTQLLDSGSDPFQAMTRTMARAKWRME